MGRMFGTDGIRGIANKDLTCELALKVGAAGAYVLTSEVRNPKILVGCDTRKSGDMLSSALIAGICSVGGDVVNVDVLPTPAMAYLVRLYEADAAVMISASHNSMEYNGIKWFDNNGHKLSDELEDRIEAIIRGEESIDYPIGEDVGVAARAKRAKNEYIEFLKSTATSRFDGLKIVLDCANGASSGIAKQVFSDLGAEVITIGDEPDGCNINDLCGSTHPERLQNYVTNLDADAGFAFDGDADRVIAVDEHGNIVDGDRIMGVCAISMKNRGELKNNTLVVAVMSNIGLKRKMQQEGIAVAETAVGDRYVLECMMKNGYNLGGEQSGHIIFLDKNSTGDGMLSAIQMLNVLKASGKSMSALANEITIYPQILVNVIVDNEVKNAVLEDEDVINEAKKAETQLGERGRVLLRKSGTEPLIRIMLEGDNEKEIEELAILIANVIIKKYNGKIKN